MFGLSRKLDRIIDLLESIAFQRLPKEKKSIKEKYPEKLFTEKVEKKKFKAKKKKRYTQRPFLKEWRGKPRTKATEELVERLKRIRQDKEISQNTVARLIGKGITQTHVSQFERMEDMNAFDYIAIVDFIEHIDDTPFGKEKHDLL